MFYFEGFTDIAGHSIKTYLQAKGHAVHASISPDTARLTGISAKLNGLEYWRIPVTLNNTYTIGFALKVWNWNYHLAGETGGPIDFLFLTSDVRASEHITLQLVQNGELAVKTKTDTVTTSGVRGKNLTWFYVEFKFVVHNTAGSYTLKVNGVEYLNRTGINTFDAGNLGVDNVAFDYQGNASRHIVIDDLYIGSDFVGDSRIDFIEPDGIGAESDWTPLAGDNYTNVQGYDADTTYVETSTNTHQDLYTYDDLAVLGTIHAVQMSVGARETDATDFNIEQLVRIGTTIYDETPVAIAGTVYETNFRVMTVNPATLGIWTVDTINAAQFGFEATT